MLGRKVQAEPVEPKLPPAIAHVWHWFQEIIRGVQGNGYSYPQVTWSELDSWSRMTRQEPAPHEARSLIVLGIMHANIMSESLGKNGGKS